MANEQKYAGVQNVLVGIIGGTGLYNLEHLTKVTEIQIETPWGAPSSPVTISELPSGVQVAFIARHGTAHSIHPSSVPARANIAALKSLGVKAVIAFSAVGSLRQDIRPGDFVIPDQIIDRTKGIRPASFFQDTSIVAHAMFGDPFDTELVKLITPHVKDVVEAVEGDVRVHTDKCVVVMEGPQFSTRAESHMYRQWGGDIINMSTLPEAKLAREAELSYALIATSTDYDSWRVSEEPVTVAEIIKTLKANAETSKKVAAVLIEHVADALGASKKLAGLGGSMQYSMVTRKETWKPEDQEKLSYILPAYFTD